jgi:hypothetical protein
MIPGCRDHYFREASVRSSLRVFVGVDPATGRRRYRSSTVRGSRTDAERALALMVASVRSARAVGGSLVGERADGGLVRNRFGWVGADHDPPDPIGP